MKKWITRLLPVFVLGGLAGYGAGLFLPGESGETEKEKEPLYWVAPMDSSYKRDEPGQSPMGMDLVPVYEEDDKDQPPGTVTVSGRVQQQLALTTARVKWQAVPQRLRASGLAVFNGAFLERRHSRVEGWITELSVDDVGDAVKQGDRLYRIYSPALVSAQQEMLTALDSGEAGLIAAAEDRLRALGVAERTIANLKKQRRVLRELPFYSGQDGVVSELGIRQGSHVQPNDLLVAVGNPRKLWIEADLLERQAALVSEGDQAKVHFDALPGETWTGRVSYIYPRIDEQTRSARVRVLLDNTDGRVMPGMFARVDLQSAAGEPVLSIPRSALIRAAEGDRVVRQVDEKHFRSVPVRAGRENGDRVAILEGLSEGDEVVTSAQFLIDSESARAGARLRLEGDHD